MFWNSIHPPQVTYPLNESFHPLYWQVFIKKIPEDIFYKILGWIRCGFENRLNIPAHRWSVSDTGTYILAHITYSRKYFIIPSLDNIAVEIFGIFFAATTAVVLTPDRKSVGISLNWYYTHAEYARQISMTTAIRNYRISVVFIVYTGRIIIIIL